MLETDHLLVFVDVEVSNILKKNMARNQHCLSLSHSKSLMKSLKNLSERDDFWNVFESKCEDILSEFQSSETHLLDENYDEFLSLLDFSIKETAKIKKPSPPTLSARLKASPSTNNLRISRNRLLTEKQKYRRNDVIRRELNLKIRQVNQKLRQAVNFEKSKFRQEQIREIERLKKTHCKQMWLELKRLAGWESREQLPESVLNKEEREVTGEQALEVWKETFEKLGKEDLDDELIPCFVRIL